MLVTFAYVAEAQERGIRLRSMTRRLAVTREEVKSFYSGQGTVYWRSREGIQPVSEGRELAAMACSLVRMADTASSRRGS